MSAPSYREHYQQLLLRNAVPLLACVCQQLLKSGRIMGRIEQRTKSLKEVANIGSVSSPNKAHYVVET